MSSDHNDSSCNKETVENTPPRVIPLEVPGHYGSISQETSVRPSRRSIGVQTADEEIGTEHIDAPLHANQQSSVGDLQSSQHLTYKRPEPFASSDMGALPQYDTDMLSPLVQPARGYARQDNEGSGSNIDLRTDDEYLDVEFYANSGRYQIHKNYMIFLSNWRVILNIILIANFVLLGIFFFSEYFVALFSTGGLTAFDNFVLIIVSLIGNFFNLSFNKIGLYTSSDLKLNSILTILPLLNLGILYALQFTRERLGTATILVHLWTSFTFFLGIIQSYKLRKYIKNLAPPTTQNKHSLKEWIQIAIRGVCKGITLILLTLLLLKTLLSAIDIRNALSNTQAEFELHNSGNYNAFQYTNSDHTTRLHIRCYGIDRYNSRSGNTTVPIVLFEHGGEDTPYLSGKWIEELYHLGKLESYCVYDRFGYGLSDSTDAPISLRKSAEALRYALVDEMGLKGPFLVVGFDYGGLVARVFAGDNSDMCAGLMLVEAWNEELLLKHYLRRLFSGGKGGVGDGGRDGDSSEDRVDYRIPEREVHKMNGFRSWLSGIWSSFGLSLQASWIIRHHGSMDRVFGRDMKYQGKFLRNKVLEAISSSLLSYKEILESNLKLQNIKLSVVSSKEMIRKSSVWGTWQRKLSKLSGNTKEWKIIDGGHEFYKNGVGVEQAQGVLLRLLYE